MNKSTNDKNSTNPSLRITHVSGSVFTRDEENELQRLVRKIKYKQPTIVDMKKADELTRKKWKAESIF